MLMCIAIITRRPRRRRFVSMKKRVLIAGVLLKVKYIPALKLAGSVLKQQLPGSGSRPASPSSGLCLETMDCIFREVSAAGGAGSAARAHVDSSLRFPESFVPCHQH